MCCIASILKGYVLIPLWDQFKGSFPWPSFRGAFLEQDDMEWLTIVRMHMNPISVVRSSKEASIWKQVGHSQFRLLHHTAISSKSGFSWTLNRPHPFFCWLMSSATIIVTKIQLLQPTMARTWSFFPETHIFRRQKRKTSQNSSWKVWQGIARQKFRAADRNPF